jgi:hypothetical protein
MLRSTNAMSTADITPLTISTKTMAKPLSLSPLSHFLRRRGTMHSGSDCEGWIRTGSWNDKGGSSTATA